MQGDIRFSQTDETPPIAVSEWHESRRVHALRRKKRSIGGRALDSVRTRRGVRPCSGNSLIWRKAPPAQIDVCISLIHAGREYRERLAAHWNGAF